MKNKNYLLLFTLMTLATLTISCASSKKNHGSLIGNHK